jgi:hypothetical protein
MSRRVLGLLAVLGVVAGGALLFWVRSLPPDLPPPPTPAQIQALEARRDALGERLRAAVIAHGEKSLMDAPRGGIMLGLPTSFTRSIVQQVVTGLFTDMTLTLRNLKVHKEGEVKAKMLIRRKTVGAYVLDVDIKEVMGVLQPGTPELRFSTNRIDVLLPVRLARGEGRADLRFQWDSKGLAANVVCGDVDTTKAITGGVVPADYQLEGGFVIAARGEAVTLRPDFPDLAVRIVVDPSEQAWGVVDEVIKERRKTCEIALNKVDVKAQLEKILGRGFNVKIPQKILKPVRLPAGVTQSLEVQGVKLPVTVKFTGVLVAEDRIWYGADVELGRLSREEQTTSRRADPR